MFSDFPTLHPLIVHFPIVLILLGVAFQAAVVWGNWQQIRLATLLIMGAAFFAALAASTVFHAMPSDDAPKEAMEIFESHETFASYTLWMSGITFLLRCIGEFFKIFRRPYEILVLVAALISATFLSIAGHHGAKLTHVAGVGPMGRYLMKDHHGDHGSAEDMKGMKGMKDDSTMKNVMPGMDTMKNMDDMENMPGMEKKNTKKMKGTGEMKNMENMKDKPGMKKMKGMSDMKKMDNMEDIPGMAQNEKKKMKGMDKTNDMQGMDMSGKDENKDAVKGMDMKGMSGKNNMKTMKDKNKPGMQMSDMNMKTNPLDTFKFEDNNPVYQNKNRQ